MAGNESLAGFNNNWGFHQDTPKNHDTCYHKNHGTQKFIFEDGLRYGKFNMIFSPHPQNTEKKGYDQGGLLWKLSKVRPVSFKQMDVYKN